MCSDFGCPSRYFALDRVSQDIYVAYPGRGVSWGKYQGAVAQLGERLDRTQEVRGSSPLSSIDSAPWCNWQHV